MTKANSEIQHIAIVMDGNRRWAKKHAVPASMGHRKGAETLKQIVSDIADMGVKFLTLYAFSTENWQREPQEVEALMNLLREYLKHDLQELVEKKVRVNFIGERDMLDADIVLEMEKLEHQTQNFDKMQVCIALSYGSRQEIVAAVKKIAAAAKRGDLLPDDIDVKIFSDMLYTKGIPEPDLVIRTGGEQRISNFLLWQIAYAELFFTDVLWPDFSKKNLTDIIDNFYSRERRYGKM